MLVGSRPNERVEDWWQQMKDTLNTVEFLVLVMTPVAIASQWTRKEWVYARQRGGCVFPVIASPDLNFDARPHWMRDVHFYDINHQWINFINALNEHAVLVEDLPSLRSWSPVCWVKAAKNLKQSRYGSSPRVWGKCFQRDCAPAV